MHKHNGLQQETRTMSQFLWVRNLDAAFQDSCFIPLQGCHKVLIRAGVLLGKFPYQAQVVVGSMHSSMIVKPRALTLYWLSAKAYLQCLLHGLSIWQLTSKPTGEGVNTQRYRQESLLARWKLQYYCASDNPSPLPYSTG